MPGNDDDRVPRAAHVPRRLRVPCRAVRRDPRRRSSRATAEAGLLIHEGQLTYAAAGPREDRRPGRVVAARDRAAAAARRERRPPRPRRRSRLHDLSAVLAESISGGAGEPRGGARLRAAVRPRARRRARRPLRRHVRERADPGLRRRGARGRARADAPRRGDRRLRLAGPASTSSASLPRCGTGGDPLRRPHSDRALRRRARGRAAGRPRGARDRSGGRALPAFRPARSRTSGSAAPTRRARTTATSRGWRLCSPGCPTRSPA